MKVYITPQCHAEIMHYVHKSNVEISGLGRIQKNSTGDMVVTKVYLLEQENGPATTDIDKDAVAKLMFESREDPGFLNFWWHSHVNMGTFWSGTDMSTIEEFGKNGFLLATVFNKKGEFRTAYYQGATDFLPSVFVDQIETSFMYLPTQEQLESWNKEFETKAREKKYEPAGSVWSRGFYYNSEKQADGIGHDPNVPLTHYDEDYYTIKPKAQTFSSDEVVGYHSGMTVKELCSAVRDMYFNQGNYPATSVNLQVDAYLMLCDVWDIARGNGADPEGEDIEELYQEITGSAATMSEVIYALQEEPAYIANFAGAKEEKWEAKDPAPKKKEAPKRKRGRKPKQLKPVDLKAASEEKQS